MIERNLLKKFNYLPTENDSKKFDAKAYLVASHSGNANESTPFNESSAILCR